MQKIFALFLVGAMVIPLSGRIFAQEEKPEGQIIFENKCGQCHPLSKALSKTKSLEEWQSTVERMYGKKPSLFEKTDIEKIVSYLALKDTASETTQSK